VTKKFIRLGDKHSHGGVVTTASATARMHGRNIARQFDKVTCPRCGDNYIMDGDATMIVDGRPVALEGHKTACGAVLQASQTSTGRGSEGSANKSAQGATEVATALPANTTSAVQAYDRNFLLTNNQTGKPLPDTKYRLTLDDGSSIEGITDENGMTQRVAAATKQGVKIEVFL